MSDVQEQHFEEHSSPIKTPKQLIVTVVLAFIVPVIIIIMLVNLVAAGSKTGAGSDTLSPESIAKRIAPVARFELVDANAPRVLKTGEQVYAAVCAACHSAGVAGAPKTGDSGAWAKFIGEGFDSMLKVAIEGKGAMPAKGGNPTLDDLEVARAVVYMANQSGGSFPEPAEPAEAKEEAAPAQAAAPAPAAAAPAPAPAAAPAPSAETVNVAGEKLYKQNCFACHAAGVAGAPKFGDKAAWAKYVETGMDAMLEVAIKGKGAMPPRGGALNASDDDLRAAIQYMVDALN